MRETVVKIIRNGTLRKASGIPRKDVRGLVILNFKGIWHLVSSKVFFVNTEHDIVIFYANKCYYFLFGAEKQIRCSHISGKLSRRKIVIWSPISEQKINVVQISVVIVFVTEEPNVLVAIWRKKIVCEQLPYLT